MSRSKYSNTYKVDIFDRKIIDELNQVKKTIYHESKELIFDNEGVGFISWDFVSWFKWLNTNRKYPKYDCAYLLMESKRRKAQKVRKKIEKLVFGDNAIFITLTFTDAVLKSTTAETRRRYVARFLKSQGCDYVANVDFSPSKQREHYHAVINSRVDLNAWKYGFIYAEKVRTHKNDLLKVSKYITKLTSHALKVDSTRLIYSRCV